MVATTSCHGPWWSSSVTAGYSSRNRSTALRARARAPYGGSGRTGFFGLALAKQPSGHACDLAALGAARQAARSLLHDRPEAARAARLDIRHDLADLRLQLL